MFRSQPYLENTKYDWYNAYFRVDFKLEAKANGANIGADTKSAPINGSFSLIQNLQLSSAGKKLYEANNIHKGIFIKNMFDFSDDFSRSVAKNQFWYLDSDATTATDNNATNLGMRARALLSHEGEIVKTIIPLNRYSFFEGLSDRLLSPLQLEFEIVLQDDREMIFQNDGTARRIVVRKFELWVPQLHFTGKGQTLANENFLKPTQWKYLNENLKIKQQLPKGCEWFVVDYTWDKRPQACLCIFSTNSETKFLYTKPLPL